VGCNVDAGASAQRFAGLRMQIAQFHIDGLHLRAGLVEGLQIGWVRACAVAGGNFHAVLRVLHLGDGGIASVLHLFDAFLRSHVVDPLKRKQ
jgi:hypothetical protein